ncbi:MAG: DNA-3-methyladenine glycosylase [Armatimonadota bacterium]|nr:DNA-3-methyladenine glycosylase [Armatimonadota bacterium]
MIIPLPEPFDTDKTLAFLRASSLRTPYRFFERRVRRHLRVHDTALVVEFDFTKPGRLRLKAFDRAGVAFPHPDWTELQRISTFIWGLDDDLGRCYDILNKDSRLAQLVQRYAGLRMIRAPDLYEALLTAVLGQQVSVAAGAAIRRRFLEELGDRIVVDEEEYLNYPPPRRLLSVPPAKLLRCGISRQKARYLLEIAERAAAGALEESTFAGLSDEAAIAKLMEIPGVGRWTAEVVLMRGLGRLDVFPAADLGLIVAVQRLRRLKARPTEQVLRKIAERWKGWRSYAALYLWATLGGGV